MLTTTDFVSVCSGIGVQAISEEIPSMLLAEYFRAAATSLYSNEPISSQRLIALIESRLRPLGYTRNRFADECFGADETASKPLTVLNTLRDIGDFVRVDNGGYYPAESRFVRIDSSLYLIASALPTATLKLRIHEPIILTAIGRLALAPPRTLSEQSIESWLQTPTLNFADYASERMRYRGSPMNALANGWQVYDASRKAKCWISVRERASHATHLCRFQPEGVAIFQYGIAALSSAKEDVVCKRFVPLNFTDQIRVKYGLHIISGVSRPWFCRVRQPWIQMTVSDYEGTEIIRLLKSISVEFQSITQKRTTFWVSMTLHKFLANFLTRFGINLVVTP